MLKKRGSLTDYHDLIKDLMVFFAEIIVLPNQELESTTHHDGMLEVQIEKYYY
jgi:hypothetical protein